MNNRESNAQEQQRLGQLKNLVIFPHQRHF